MDLMTIANREVTQADARIRAFTNESTPKNTLNAYRDRIKQFNVWLFDNEIEVGIEGVTHTMIANYLLDMFESGCLNL